MRGAARWWVSLLEEAERLMGAGRLRVVGLAFKWALGFAFSVG